MAKIFNRAKMTTATTGTGTITLGSAVAGFQSFAAAGVADADVVRYVIVDGVNWEIGTGTYTASGTTLTRSVDESSNADAAINLSGAAQVFIGLAAEDVIADFAGVTFAGGDTIYHNGSKFVRLPKGTAGQVLTMNGGATAPAWATFAAGSLLNVQVFTSNGTWNRTTGATKALVFVTGAGAGGGDDLIESGSAGGTAIGFIDVTSISSSTIAVGAGGSGNSGAGSSGGTSSWSDGTNTLTGNGGSVSGTGAAGGTATGGLLNIQGGGAGTGGGGASFWGGGGGSVSTGNGNNAHAYGAGGSGGRAGGSEQGGDGAGGVVMVLEFA